MVSRYVNGPVKQDGICLLPAPPAHYRMMQPQRTDAFHIAGPQQFVQQQPPNQAGNQAPGLRSMAPTGPPTQASTPPNTELKVQHGPQPSMNLSFGQQRGAQNYFPRPPPQSQTRMVNQRQNQQPQLYPQQTQPFVVPQLQPIYLNPFYAGTTQRPPTSYIPPNYIIQNSQMPYQFQAQNQPFFYTQMQRQAPPSAQVQPIQQNMTHAPPPNAPQAALQTIKTKVKREHAIPIINPTTGKEISSDDMSNMASGESSARQTPQPPPSKEVQATFAKQVAQAISNDNEEHEHHQQQQQVTVPPLIEHHIEPSPPPHSAYHHNPNTQAVHNSVRNDLVQSSKLQVPTKDFVPANQSNTAKETPVVSAISNAVEVTITGKQKDRESPAKGRKQKENSQREQQQHQVTKETMPKEAKSEPEKGIKEEKQKEVILSTSPGGPVLPQMDTKAKKVEKMVEVSKPPHNAVQDVHTEAAPVQTNPPHVQENAKSKQNSQRGKDAPKQQGGAGAGNPKQPQPQTMPVQVPVSQPAKPNNKSNKMKELNMKGATKEGTDMDAFSDTASEMVLNDNAQTAVPTTIVIEATKKEPEVEEVIPVPIKTETKPMRNKIDVTDIVKDIPKPYVAAVPIKDNKDETDRAAINNDKLVHAKNQVNAKASLDGDDNFERPSLPYKENQWSPYNKDGKKVYDRDFLMALRTVPKSKQKPDNLLNEIIAQDDKSRVGDVSRYAMGGRADFTPSFGNPNFAGKSQSQRGVATKRGSQQGKIGGGGSKGGKSGSVIRVSISFKEDVKLHETENAWKPARLNPGVQTDDDKKTEELYKKVRGVLNKLTPQKFNTLLNQIKTLPIDTSERLQGVIDLVFEKAVDEPNFSIAYALMCRELALMQVPISAESKDFVNFRKLLITRCQLEFEKNSNEEGNRNEKMKEIEECTNPEKKKELTVQLEEDDRRIRMKSVGNIRFIGELFKQQMLTVSIMVRCLQNLLENRDEERLECLCKLLTTVGRELELQKKVDLSQIFNIMKEIADKKNGKVSSRVRFMLQDVIDLRASNWVPRRQDLNPKTIDQIQKEADHEQLTIQVMNATTPAPRKDDRNMGPNSDRKQRGRMNNSNEDGWTVPTPSRKNTAFSIQSDKLKIKQIPGELSLGSISQFDCWSRGSNTKSNNTQPPVAVPPAQSVNMYACLEKIGDMDNKSSMSSRTMNKDPYMSKGTSLERSYKHFEGRNSRSGSQHRSNENSQRSTPTSVQQLPFKMPPAPAATGEPQQEITLTPEQFEVRVKNIIQEYLNESTNFDETNTEIQTTLPPSALSKFIFEILNYVLDRSKTARLNTGKLIADLINRQTITLILFCDELEKVFNLSEELIVDIPNIWDYYAELIVALVTEELLSLRRLHTCCDQANLIRQGYGRNLLVSLFKLVVLDKGPNFLTSIWKASKLSFQDFMDAKQVESFINDNNLQFLVGSNVTAIGSNLTYPEIQDKLLKFIKTNTSFDDITEWITANLGDRMKEKLFIRVLVTVLIESSILNYKLNVEILHDFYPFFQRYIDSNPDFELQCLYAIQSIVNKLDHPQGLLLKIFNTLYEDNIISYDSFMTWENSEDPAEKENKGVALKQLTSFFTQMKENDEESASSGSEDT